MKEISKGELIEVCQKILRTSSYMIAEYREGRIDDKEISEYLLRALLSKLRAKQNIDPHITLTIKVKLINKEEDDDPYLEGLNKLLEECTRFNYLEVIENELLGKVKNSLINSLMRWFHKVS